MRPEGNPLDLNNFPDDSSRDGCSERKRSKDGKEYECRFCSLKFCKSQALGGHMNRHRQERETESLNKARELVLRNDTFPAQGASPFCYHPAGQMGDTTLYRPVYSPRLFSAASSSSTLPPPRPPPQPYLYPPPPPRPSSLLPSYPVNEYYPSHALDDKHSYGELQSCPRHQTLSYMGGGNRSPAETGYTFIGAPVGHGGFSTPPSTIVNRFQDNGF